MILIKAIIRPLKVALAIISFLLFHSCNSCNDKETPNKEDYPETMNSGNLTAYCDESISNLLDSALVLYRIDYPRVNLTLETGNARQVMAKLLAGEARVILTARDYLSDEDSLMKIYNVDPHLRMPMAYDALVFFVNMDFPLDTLNSAQISEFLQSEKNVLTKHYKDLRIEPELICPNVNSSEYANLMSLCNDNKNIARRIKFLEDSKSVKEHINQNNNSIGVCFLSEIVNDTSYKLLKIGFVNPDGRSIRPRQVHQAYIVQDLYPYKVTLWAYVLQDVRNLPFWFAKYLSVEEKIQRYFLNRGIVPAYARVKLIKEE